MDTVGAAGAELSKLVTNTNWYGLLEVMQLRSKVTGLDGFVVGPEPPCE